MERREAGGSRQRTAAAIAAIMGLTFAAFLPVLRAEFLQYDDQIYVTENSMVLPGLTARGIVAAFTTTEHGAIWHPVSWLSHMLDVSLFGLRPAAHHFTSLILHAAAAALLYVLLQGLTGAFWSSFLGAAVFAVHPLRVESVAWITERKDVLAGLFAMLTLLAYLRYVRRPGTRRYGAVIALFALGLMAKAMLVTLPFALLLLDWWPLGRVRTDPGAGAFAPVTAGRGLLLEKAPLLILALASAIVTYIAQHSGQVTVSLVSCPLAQRIGNAAVSYLRYIEKTVWPRDLYPFYPHPGAGLSLAAVAASIAALVAVTAAAFRVRSRWPSILAGWLWYLGTLVPVIGLVQVGEQGMADRYTYLPSIGLLLALVGVSRSGAARWAGDSRVVRGAAAAGVALLALLTWHQTRHWKDTGTLGRRMLAGDPRNTTALNLLGADCLQRGDSAGAAAFLVRAIDLNPGFLDARFNLGLALARGGSPEAAIQQFTAVIGARPDDAESLANRGRLLLEKGLAAAALRDIDAALAVSPDHPQILHLRGLALAQLNRPSEAVAPLLRVAALTPEGAEVRYHLGRVYDAMNHPAEAIASYREALAIRPDYPEVHNNLGMTLVKLGRAPEALPHFREAVRLSPSYAEARWNLERTLHTLELQAISPRE